MNVKLLNYENLERKLLMQEKSLVEKSNIITDIEAENRTYKQQVHLKAMGHTYRALKCTKTQFLSLKNDPPQHFRWNSKRRKPNGFGKTS